MAIELWAAYLRYVALLRRVAYLDWVREQVRIGQMESAEAFRRTGTTPF